MISLVIDTSTNYLYLGLVKDDKILKEVLVDTFKNHASLSVKNIHDLLNEFSLTTQDLTEVVCGIGPGSYTGVRISLTIAKMITSFMNIPLKTISTLFLMSSGYNEKVLALIDARRDNYFSAIYLGNEVLLNEKLRHFDELPSDCMKVYPKDFKVDLFKVLKNAKIETKVDEVVPNYLRITEAEYNLKND